MTTVSEVFETMAYGPAPESDKPALEWIARHDGAFGLFIGGRWADGKSDAGFDVINPATTARLARVTQAGETAGERERRRTPVGGLLIVAGDTGLPGDVLAKREERRQANSLPIEPIGKSCVEDVVLPFLSTADTLIR